MKGNPMLVNKTVFHDSLLLPSAADYVERREVEQAR